MATQPQQTQQVPPRVLSDDEYAKLSAGERYAYAKEHSEFRRQQTERTTR